jgi:hypothetical protein
MRTQFARLLCLMFLAVSDAYAQTTAPAPGTVSPPTAEVDGGVAEWWWVIVLLLLAGLAAWYFMRGRTRT